MRDFILKTLVPALVALLAATGAFSLQINYEKGKTQESIGKLVVNLTRGCQK